jgi:Ca2+-binding EF-hand superfamily protein
VQLSLGFDDTIGSDTVTLGFVLQDTCRDLKDAHACYAAALAISTDLALSLICPEEQIRIQDIFQGPHYMHLTVCITSNETHDSSAQSLGLQLIRDSVNCDSRVRSVLPSIALVQWMPDRAKAGLSQRYLSERTNSSTRSQLSHLDTLRQERSGQEKPGYQRQGTFWGDGILRHAPADPAASGGAKQQQGSVPESKWNRLRKLHVHITLHDKVAEAHKIFDKMDTDSNGSLTCQEIKKAMLSSGFKEDEILTRLPHLKSGDADDDGVLSREEFVNYWVHSRDEDPSRLFDRLDLDQNGTLSPAELRAGLLQEGFSDEEILKRLPFIFKQMDVDGYDSISKEEFVSKWNSIRDSGFFGSSFGQVTSLVRLPLPSMPALSPALAVLPASISGAGSRVRCEEREPSQDAAGVFAGLMSATSDVFEAVGRSLLPDHLQNLMMPLPDDDNGPSNQLAGPVDRSRRPISRVPGSVPASMHRKRLSPRELLYRAISAKSGTSDIAQENRGLAAMLRNRLGNSTPGTSGEPGNDQGLTSPGWAPGLPLQIALFPPVIAAHLFSKVRSLVAL